MSVELLTKESQKVRKVSEYNEFLNDNKNLISPPVESLIKTLITNRRKSGFLSLAMEADREQSLDKTAFFEAGRLAFDILFNGAYIPLDEISRGILAISRLRPSEHFYMNLDPLYFKREECTYALIARVACLAGFGLYNDSNDKPFFPGQKNHNEYFEKLFWRDFYHRIDQQAGVEGVAKVLLKDLCLKNSLQYRMAYPRDVSGHFEAEESEGISEYEIPEGAFDCMRYIFPETEDLPRAVTSIPMEWQEVSKTQTKRGDIVLYFNKNDHFTHIGRVDSKKGKIVMIDAKLGWTGPIVTEPIEYGFYNYGHLTRFFRPR